MAKFLQYLVEHQDHRFQADQIDQAVLLKLIHLEVELRRGRGQPIDTSVLATQFPQVDSDWLSELVLLPPAPPVQLPQLPARYQPIREIGRGGIGTVWRVHDEVLKRTLAAKILRPRYQSNRAANIRLDREALLTGLLQHPGIPPVHDRGVMESGASFFTMKLVDGHTLESILQGEQSPLSELLGIFEQIAQTIAYAHSQQVIHRDLKPQNVMVGRFGELQIMDWGMAKQLGVPDSEVERTVSAAESDPATEDAPAESVLSSESTFPGAADPLRTLTRQGEVFGTPAYMPPEQALGDLGAMRETSDVFGLGAILFQILTQRRLYFDVPSDELMTAVANTELSGSLSLLDAAAVDDELKQLCRSCLQADPTRRPANGQQVAEQMANYLQSVSEKLRASELSRSQAEIKIVEERKRRKLATALAITVVVGVLLAVTAVVWYQLDQQRLEAINRQDQAETLVSTLASTPTPALPYAVDQLKPLESYAVPHLQKVFTQETDRGKAKLHYAIALARFGQLEPHFLDELPSLQPDELTVAAETLKNHRKVALADIRKQYQRQTDLEVRAKLAYLAMALGSDELAAEMTSDSMKPLDRVRFILFAKTWSGDPENLLNMADSKLDALSRYAALSALASIPSERVEASFRERAAGSLSQYYLSAKSANVRAAAELVMKRWQLPLPKYEPQTEDELPSDRDWYVNSLGMVMTKHDYPLLRDEKVYEFAAADRETTIHQFLEYLRQCPEDANRPVIGSNSNGSTYRESMEHDVQFEVTYNGHEHTDYRTLAMRIANYADVLRFCNWLSRREGLEPVYRDLNAEQSAPREQPNPWWRINPGANGYRLLTNTEFAHLSGAIPDRKLSRTYVASSFADHLDYEWILRNTSQPMPVATRLPNRFGMFDMLGSVREYGQFWYTHRRDEFGDIRNVKVQFPKMGGSIKSTVTDNSFSATILFTNPATDTETGFRVARCDLRNSLFWYEFQAINSLYFRFLDRSEFDQLSDGSLVTMARELNRSGLDMLRFQRLDAARNFLQLAQRLSRARIQRDEIDRAAQVDLAGAIVNQSIVERIDNQPERAIRLTNQATTLLREVVEQDSTNRLAKRYLANAVSSRARAQLGLAMQLSQAKSISESRAEQIKDLATQSCPLLKSEAFDDLCTLVLRLQNSQRDLFASVLQKLAVELASGPQQSERAQSLISN